MTSQWRCGTTRCLQLKKQISTASEIKIDFHLNVFQEFYFTVANCHRKFVWYFPEISSTFVSHGISGGELGDGNSGEKGLGREAYRRPKETVGDRAPKMVRSGRNRTKLYNTAKYFESGKRAKQRKPTKKGRESELKG